MESNQYSIRYLPLFYDELGSAVEYISGKLGNVQAANNLLDDVEYAILERLPFAESFEQYESKNEHRYPYYRIYVGNYIIFYVVIKDEKEEPIMEIRRFLYSGQNIENKV